MSAAPVILMVAPNGARRGKADHPALPVTVAETAAEAARCRAAGAAAIHAHVRDAEGAHVLDAGLYRELTAEIARAAPGMLVQVTTEAVGRYSPAEQAALVRDLRPAMVSVALREMAPEGTDLAEARRFYPWAAEAGVHVQHILYAPEEARRLDALEADGTIPAGRSARLFVLGRYSGEAARPGDLAGFALPAETPWFACAFGPAEAACMAAAMCLGGHARIGFENNLALPDGTTAPDNAALVRAAAGEAAALGRPVATPGEARAILGLPPSGDG